MANYYFKGEAGVTKLMKLNWAQNTAGDFISPTITPADFPLELNHQSTLTEQDTVNIYGVPASVIIENNEPRIKVDNQFAKAIQGFRAFATSMAR